MDKRQLLIICGISGAGKSVTMDFLDSQGFYCIDNLPVKLLSETIYELKNEEHYFDFAIALNSNATKAAINDVINSLKDYDWLDTKIIFLDVDNEEILKRFQYTRKAHPFINQNEGLIEAINHERKLLSPFKQYADVIIDTSELNEQQLVLKLESVFTRKIERKFKVSFISYGYKYGLPKDLDFAFDVRFIPNPFYVDELKNLTGNDQAVYDYVMSQEETKEFIKYAIPLLEYAIEQHKKSNRSYLVIGFGCTGGQHRSVTLANYMANYFMDKYEVIKDHRNARK